MLRLWMRQETAMCNSGIPHGGGSEQYRWRTVEGTTDGDVTGSRRGMID